MHLRLQNSERERKQSDESDKDMRVELEGKVDALQKQLTDLDTLRLITQLGKKRLKMRSKCHFNLADILILV